MKMRKMETVLVLAVALCGCVSVGHVRSEDVVVQASVCVGIEDPDADNTGAFFLRRSLLCRQAFTEAMAELADKTGRSDRGLLGATVCGIDEKYTNGVYTLSLDVAWSEDREAAVERILSVTNSASGAGYVPSVDEDRALANWIGPKQVRDLDGTIHFLGVSAMAIGRNTVLSRQNMRRAELDAQAMAVRSFNGREMKMSDVKVNFRQVFALRSRHPLCPNREMYACGYEVIAVDNKVK